MMSAWKFCLVLLCVLFCAVRQPRQVFAGEVITVTTTEDELNEDGDCALREAIQAANLGHSVDDCTIIGSAPYTITLLSESYQLTLAGAYEDENASGDLDIVTSMSLVGQETISTSLDGVLLDRIIHIHAGSSVTISHVVLQNGKVPDAFSQSQSEQNHGGAIFNDGTLTLSHALVVDNQAGSSTFGIGGSGGGIYSSGSMTISESILRNNQAGNGADDLFEPVERLDGGGGGGLYNVGELWLTDSVVYGNAAGRGGWEAFNGGDGGSGGGLLNTGVMVIARSIISDNVTAEGSGGLGAASSGDGGGIANFGFMTLDLSSVVGNATANGVMGSHVSASGGNGGGIFNQGTMTMTTSSIGLNVTGDGGWHGATVGSAAIGGSGGGIYNEGFVVVLDSTVYSNRTGQGGFGRPGASGGFGCGLYNFAGGAMTISQSTISGNECGNGGTGEAFGSGGNGGSGGGIFNHGALTVTYATINDNRTGLGSPGSDPADTSADGADGQGGGVANAGAGILALGSSIIAGNEAHENVTTADCTAFGGDLRSMGYNLSGVDSGCPLDAPGDLATAFPLLGPLAEHGGPTWVHPISIGSPAVDAGDNADCPSTDQRGVARPTDGDGDGIAVCDIGAFEAPAGYRLRLPMFESP